MVSVAAVDVLLIASMMQRQTMRWSLASSVVARFFTIFVHYRSEPYSITTLFTTSCLASQQCANSVFSFLPTAFLLAMRATFPLLVQMCVLHPVWDLDIWLPVWSLFVGYWSLLMPNPLASSFFVKGTIAVFPRLMVGSTLQHHSFTIFRTCCRNSVTVLADYLLCKLYYYEFFSGKSAININRTRFQNNVVEKTV